ncbi:hypothetical protein SASPL_154742 [Salvia splendens]|uniref:Serine/threonine-protein kinase PBS1 n=1 Tax=Salvia splendens TaxID=180675 RepID=A0A8X8YZJ0_SALSN|nr:hypothetical protein SASPL_154742 [Salvia splendens]
MLLGIIKRYLVLDLSQVAYDSIEDLPNDGMSFNAKISDLWLAELDPCGGNATLKMAIGAANEMAFLNASYSFYQRPGDHPYIRKLIRIMDEQRQGQYSFKAAARATQLTLRCLQQEPRNRPPMEEVAEVLEQISAMEKP